MKIYRRSDGVYFRMLGESENTANHCDEPKKVVLEYLTREGLLLVDHESFLGEAPPNELGQKYSFELVKDFENQLDLIPTARLVQELTTRKDSPFVGLDSGIEKEKIFLDKYAVGYNKPVFNNGVEDSVFNPMVFLDTKEEARDYLMRKYQAGERRFFAVRRLHIKVDFDA